MKQKKRKNGKKALVSKASVQVAEGSLLEDCYDVVMDGNHYRVLKNGVFVENYWETEGDNDE